MSDLKGLKIRIPGIGGEVMSRLGATVQVLAGGDIYPALERGAIDATEWVGPHDDEKLGFHKVAKYYYYPGWWEPGPSLSYYVNRDAWQQLSKEFQAIFRAAACMAATAMQTQYDTYNPAAVTRLREAGVTFKQVPGSVMKAARAATDDFMAEQAAADATYKKIYEPWCAYRKASFEWFGMAETAYANFAFASDAS